MQTLRNRIVALLAGTALLCATSRAEVIHVSADAVGNNDGTSWTHAFMHLQDALAVAQAGDQIWIAAGEYRPDESSSPLNPTPPTPGSFHAIFRILNNVEVYGGFDGTETSLAARAGLFDATILTGDLAGDDGPGFANNSENSLHVTNVSWGSAPILDGFTVTAGHANQLSTAVGGAGMLIQGSDPTIRNVTFRENIVSGGQIKFSLPFGGGVFSLNGSSPTFVSCKFIGNEAADGGGLDCDDPGNPVLIDCVFRDNVATWNGGAFWALECEPTVTGCHFEDNVAFSDGGAILGFNAPMDVSHCRFVGNAATIGGAISADDVEVADSIFTGNVSHDAAAISASDAVLTNVTIAGNTADFSTGGVSATTLTMVNSIVWGNTDASGSGEAVQVSAGTLTVDHSCIEGWSGVFGGVGNTGSDPLFVDADGPDDIVGTADDDLRLTAGSPLIDAADSTAVLPDVNDLDGDGDTTEPTPFDVDGLVRFWQDVATPDTGVGAAPIVDMGALEFRPGDLCQSDLGFQNPGNITLAVCGGDLTQAAGTATLQVAGAPAVTPVYLFLGLTNDPTPTQGGTLVPTPPTTVVVSLTDLDGILTLPVAGVAGLGATVYLQAATKAGAVTQFSNALQMEL